MCLYKADNRPVYLTANVTPRFRLDQGQEVSDWLLHHSGNKIKFMKLLRMIPEGFPGRRTEKGGGSWSHKIHRLTPIRTVDRTYTLRRGIHSFNLSVISPRFIYFTKNNKHVLHRRLCPCRRLPRDGTRCHDQLRFVDSGSYLPIRF